MSSVKAMEPYGCAAPQPSSYPATQPCKLWPDSYVSIYSCAKEPHNSAVMRSRSHAVTQPCAHAAKQRCGHCSTELCSRATTQLCVHGAVPEISQFYSQARAYHLLQMQDRITKYVCLPCQSQKTLMELLFHARLPKGQMTSKTRLLPPRSPHSYSRVGLCTCTQGWLHNSENTD